MRYSPEQLVVQGRVEPAPLSPRGVTQAPREVLLHEILLPQLARRTVVILGALAHVLSMSPAAEGIAACVESPSRGAVPQKGRWAPTTKRRKPRRRPTFRTIK